ncbi:MULTISPECIES: ArsR/SmtB family transcription factor [unclassified Acinetobacter]|uniref:ArsR/SmtB family transcription factor n=1 Tax=unclassified Acinetobacter TaxID=196816 RepID=UPI0035B9EAFF
MKLHEASQLFECLGSPIRLQIFQLLNDSGEVGLVAGDLAKQMNLAPNLMSFHLKNLSNSGLVSYKQEGRFVRYSVNIMLMHELVEFLNTNCHEANFGNTQNNI